MRCNSLKLNIYYQAFKSSFNPKKVKVLLKRKCWILCLNGQVTYDLPMTLKLILSSKLHHGISKPKFRAEQDICGIAGTVSIADNFFGGHFENMQIS